MRVLFAASECRPFASSGGLADVLEALPIAVQGRGVPSARVMPLYRRIREAHAESIRPTGIAFDVPMGDEFWPCEIFALERDDLTTYLVSREELYDRSELYGLATRPYGDNLERFLFFQKAVVLLLDQFHGADHFTHVHLNDWQTGLVPLYLHFGADGKGRVVRETSVFTIHNLAYQGVFPAAKFRLTNLPNHLFNMRNMEFFGQFSMMKAALVAADVLTTVSPTYAREIQTPENGCALDGVLKEQSAKLHGILNGVDYRQWNPATDNLIHAHFSADHLAGKTLCRKELLREFNLPESDSALVIGMVCRLTEQKGVNLIAEAMPELMARDIRFVLLGSGEEMYHQLVKSWLEQYPERFAARLGFDNALAHRIEAGADAFLMPSRFEPCGLNQMYSLKYGTLPIVTNTGGLADTIEDIDVRDGGAHAGTGFKLAAYDKASLLEALDRAIAAFGARTKWKKAMKRAMGQDFSWDRAAEAYLRLYGQ
jgi:starch synthase